jgi:hypothetical protein
MPFSWLKLLNRFKERVLDPGGAVVCDRLVAQGKVNKGIGNPP